MRSTRLERTLTRVFFAVLLCLVVVWAVFPYYWMTATSITPSSKIFAYPPRLVPDGMDWTGYAKVFDRRPILRWLVNTGVVASSSAVLTVLLASFSSYGLTRFHDRSRSFVLFVILLSQMLPAMLLVIPLFILFTRLGLTNTHLGLVVVFTGFSLPAVIWFLRTFFEAIPLELEEAAFVDGCTRWQALRMIVLPLSLPGLVSTWAYAFILAWNDVFFALTLATRDSTRLISGGLYTFVGEYVTPWDEVMAAAVVSTLPVLLLFLVMQRYIVEGLTSGSVKG